MVRLSTTGPALIRAAALAAGEIVGRAVVPAVCRRTDAVVHRRRHHGAGSVRWAGRTGPGPAMGTKMGRGQQHRGAKFNYILTLKINNYRLIQSVNCSARRRRRFLSVSPTVGQWWSSSVGGQEKGGPKCSGRDRGQREIERIVCSRSILFV